MKKILGGGGWDFIKKCWTNWLADWKDWKHLKCLEILNRVDMGNANFQYKYKFVKYLYRGGSQSLQIFQLTEDLEFKC